MTKKEHKYSNRLADESSPYLLQHAHNPVDWYPWGEEALEKARTEDKPIIVSIGYSSCHWCHVMERESFENEEIGKLMNEHFVCIKVDREERPDVDQIYVDAVQSMGMQGGWPLNAFLMPDQKPFYGGTYFPPAQWVRMLENVHKAFIDQRDKLQESADQFAQNLSHSDIQRYGIIEDSQQKEQQAFQETLDSIYQGLSARFDQEWGGMNRAPKFPMPANWQLLLRYYFYSKDKSALQQLELTLDKMALGGIYDQIGGGFARYSVDERWFAPHFEKMLYDNGQLLSLYAEAFALTHKPLYKKVISDTIAFARREMTSPEGGFYSALDADSEGEEGKFYVWKYDEFRETLGDVADMMGDYFRVNQEGNWEKQYNILFREQDEASFAKKYELDRTEFDELLDDSRQKLLHKRAERIRPGLDDKILASWNGLMLKGLVDSYAVLQQTEILELALRNAHFIADKLMRKQGERASLYRSYKEGKARLDAYLEDYAFVIDAFISLYQVTFDESWLEHAQNLSDYAVEYFYDKDEGFFFYTSEDTQLIARKKEVFDNVIPSSNSAMARNLYRLSLLLDHQEYQQIAERMMKRITKVLSSDPAYLSNWACLYIEMHQPTVEIAILGEQAKTYGARFHTLFHPNRLVLGSDGDSKLPLLSKRTAIDGKTTIYVCYDKTCKMPVHTIEAAYEQLGVSP
jgi:uncharacterized protein YyaL (SSP411 family)